MKALWASAWLHCLVLVAHGLPSRHLLGAQNPVQSYSKYAKAGCNNFTNHFWQPLRPGYHISAPYGWLNDPHGGFQRKGYTHLFFQYNPAALKWGAPLWAHVVSKDLAHWTWLPPALVPDEPYDQGGVWSGSTTVQDGDIPTITYTAAGTFVPEMGIPFQQQAIATPADLQDPLLRQWRKSDSNPFLTQVPPGGTNFQFRDPSEGRDAVWKVLTSLQNPDPLPEQHYAVVVASQSFCMGAGSIYTAPNMTGPWSFVGTLFDQLAVDSQVNGQCLASKHSESNTPFSPAFGGPCDAFGPFCRMWEVVDFAELEPGIFMLKWNDQSRFRGIFSLEWYVLGNNWDYSALSPSADEPPKHTEPSKSAATSPAGSPAASTQDASASGTPAGQQQPRKIGPADSPARQSAASVGDSVDAEQHSLSGNDKDEMFSNSASSNAFNRVEAGVLSATRSLFTGKLDGQKFEPMRTDYGSVYASSVFPTSDARQVMFSWILETAAGCIDSCSDSLPEVFQQLGFKGALTLPRLLSYSKETRSMRAYPVPETATLRGRKVYDAKRASVATLPELSAVVPMMVVSFAKGNQTAEAGQQAGAGNSSTARQLEVQVNFTISPPEASNPAAAVPQAGSGGNQSLEQRSSGTAESPADYFAVGVRLHTSNTTYTDIFLNGTVAQQHHSGFQGSGAAKASQQSRGTKHANMLRVASLEVWVDRTHEGGATNTSTAALEGGPVPLPVVDSQDQQPWLLPDQQLQLSVWVDHSVVEVYAMGGLARITSRIYPDEDDVAWGVSIWALPPRLSVSSVDADDLQALDAVPAAATGSNASVDSDQRSASPVKQHGFLYGVYCWWCKLRFTADCSCSCEPLAANCIKEDDAEDDSGWVRLVITDAGQHTKASKEAAVANQTAVTSVVDSEWIMLADVEAWEMKNAWLPPDCEC